MNGNVWSASSIEETPEVELQQWSIREIPNGDRHFVGYNITEREGRVSSKIVEFDSANLIGRTRSGRVYRLVGNPGHNDDAEYVWSRWLIINNISDFTEIEEI